MQTPRRNLVPAAAVLGGGLVLASLILAGGMWLAANRLAARLEAGVQRHATGVADAGSRIADAGARLAASVEGHSASVARAGETIAHPQIKVVDPLPIKEPVKIRGPADDGALPVEAKLAK